MTRHALTDHWTLQALGDQNDVPEARHGTLVPATVPGCAHTDLLSAGLIPDLYLDRNENDLQWIGRTDRRVPFEEATSTPVVKSVATR